MTTESFQGDSMGEGFDLNVELKKSLAFLDTVKPGTQRGPYTLPREVFDPKNRAHLESYEIFLKTGNWGEVKFHIEYPYVSVVETVMRKFALHVIAHMLGHEEDLPIQRENAA